MEEVEKGGKEEMNLLISCITFFVGGLLGGIGMALMASSSYQKGYEDGVKVNELSQTIHRTN